MNVQNVWGKIGRALETFLKFAIISHRNFDDIFSIELLAVWVLHSVGASKRKEMNQFL